MKQKLKNMGQFSFKVISASEIEKELRELNSNKATTFGNTTKILKQSSKSCSDTLQKLFDDPLREGNFLDKLKCADLTPLSKKDDPTKAKYHTPVSVVPGVPVIFERLMHMQISFYIDQFLSSYICGYRKGFSTQHALFPLTEKWEKVLDNKGYRGAILLDLSKSLDTNNHDLLIAKLNVSVFSKAKNKIHHRFW